MSMEDEHFVMAIAGGLPALYAASLSYKNYTLWHQVDGTVTEYKIIWDENEPRFEKIGPPRLSREEFEFYKKQGHTVRN